VEEGLTELINNNEVQKYKLDQTKKFK